MDMASYKVPSSFPATTSDEAAGAAGHSSTQPKLTGLFTSPVTAADTRSTLFGQSNVDGNNGDYCQFGATFRYPRGAEGSLKAPRRNCKAGRWKRQKNRLPSARKNDRAEVYLPPSDISRPQLRGQRQDPGGGRSSLPSAVRDSVGNVILPVADLGWQQQRLHDVEPDPVSSETTPSSLISAQIDDIYRLDRPVLQYFSGSPTRLPQRRNSSSVAADEHDHPINEEDSVRLALFQSL